LRAFELVINRVSVSVLWLRSLECPLFTVSLPARLGSDLGLLSRLRPRQPPSLPQVKSNGFRPEPGQSVIVKLSGEEHRQSYGVESSGTWAGPSGRGSYGRNIRKSRASLVELTEPKTGLENQSLSTANEFSLHSPYADDGFAEEADGLWCERSRGHNRRICKVRTMRSLLPVNRFCRIHRSSSL
jgi:hypothetical protein